MYGGTRSKRFNKKNYQKGGCCGLPRGEVQYGGCATTPVPPIFQRGGTKSPQGGGCCGEDYNSNNNNQNGGYKRRKQRMAGGCATITPPPIFQRGYEVPSMAGGCCGSGVADFEWGNYNNSNNNQAGGRRRRMAGGCATTPVPPIFQRGGGCCGEDYNSNNNNQNGGYKKFTPRKNHARPHDMINDDARPIDIISMYDSHKRFTGGGEYSPAGCGGGVGCCSPQAVPPMLQYGGCGCGAPGAMTFQSGGYKVRGKAGHHGIGHCGCGCHGPCGMHCGCDCGGYCDSGNQSGGRRRLPFPYRQWGGKAAPDMSVSLLGKALPKNPVKNMREFTVSAKKIAGGKFKTVFKDASGKKMEKVLSGEQIKKMLNYLPKVDLPTMQLSIPKDDQSAMPKVVIYTASWCPWCHKSLELLSTSGIKYMNIDIDLNKVDLNAVREGQQTIPAVFVDGDFLGGYAELAKYMQNMR